MDLVGQRVVVADLLHYFYKVPRMPRLRGAHPNDYVEGTVM